jgi:hypothetical protein
MIKFGDMDSKIATINMFHMLKDIKENTNTMIKESVFFF